jgi:hypothetical protein
MFGPFMYVAFVHFFVGLTSRSGRFLPRVGLCVQYIGYKTDPLLMLVIIYADYVYRIYTLE